MTATLITLDEVEDGYTVFEKDQVLSHEHLNRLARYLDEQGRLTRVALTGVGISCGLWPLLTAKGVSLSHGVATTTDGDLLLVGEETLYTHYKPYDIEALQYKPFLRGEPPMEPLELVREADAPDDARARPLSGLAASRLEAMVAVLYMESHEHDPDLCTGTDCDNRGLNALHVQRLLLVEPKHAPLLLETLDTSDRAVRRPLEPVVADRPALQGALASEAELAAIYRTACAAIHKKLLAAFGAIYEPCKFLLEELAASDPAPQWRKALEKIAADFVQNRGIQYYYDFLKDLADTYNAFRDVLFGDTTVCCPPVDAFPKHVVLGALVPRLRAAAGRTGYYPAPAVSGTDDQRAHARFLIRKIDAMIGGFALPAQPAEIRITPSAFEERALEERAIPYYYTSRPDLVPIHLVWSYAASQKGMERYAYSYHADRYAALGGAAQPFAAQIGAFDFFRIEGHLGWKVRDAAKKLRDEIRARNLPIDVETVLLGKTPGRAVFEWPWRHHDLYLLRHLVRADAAANLDEAGKYGKKLAQHIGNGIDSKTIENADVGEGVEVKGKAANKGDEIEAQTKKVKEMAGGDTSKGAFQDEVVKAMMMASDYSQQFSLVMKKEHYAPFDGLIEGRALQWLIWLDRIIVDLETKEAARLLLSAYQRNHPGLEHFAGVLRGGTFVLVHDESDTVVADFMLPYHCCERRGEAFEPPELVQVPKPTVVVDGPVRVFPHYDKYRFIKIRDDFKKLIDLDLAEHKKYLDIYKEVLVNLPKGTQVGGGTLPTGGGHTLPTGGGHTLPTGGDVVLETYVLDTIWKEERVDRLRTEMVRTDVTADERVVLEAQYEVAQEELGTAIITQMQHVAAKDMSVGAGSDGAKVLGGAAKSLAKVSNVNALARVDKAITGIAGKASTGPEMKGALNNLLNTKAPM